MKTLAWPTRLYLLLCYVFGAFAGWWLVVEHMQSLPWTDWLLTAGCIVVASACQVFVIKRAGTNYSDNLTPAPLFAAVLLAPHPLLAIIIVASFIPEWFVYRRKWFIQTFNIASYLIGAAVAYLVYELLTGAAYRPTTEPLHLPGVVAMGVTFLGVQTLLTAWVLRLARGQTIRESGLFAPTKLGVEAAVLSVGITFALSWLYEPAFGIIAAVPLLLIFRALHVPNLVEEASTDPKTGLANMRHFNAAIVRELERAERTKNQSSLVVCDLDFLRNINNTYGHQAGDIVLLGISDIIRRNISGKDIAARFGGEEFIILLSESTTDATLELAERIRSELEQSIFDGGPVGPLNATVSIGVAIFPDDGKTPEMLMREADLALYQAKREGRNRVVVSGRRSRELAGEWAREHLVRPEATPASQEAHTPRWRIVSEMTRDHINSETKATTKVRALRQPKSAAAQKGRKPGMTPTMYTLIAAVFAAGLATVGAAWTPIDVSVWSLLLLIVLTIVAEQIAVDTGGRARTSVGVVVVLAATFLYGTFGIIATVFALVMSVAIKARSPLNRVMFNLGTVLLSAEGANLVFQWFSRHEFTADNFAFLLPAAMLAGLSYYAINHLLLCAIRGLHEGRSIIAVWINEYRWLWPHYLVLGALALVVAFGNILLGTFGVLALMAPVGMMHLTIKQYMERTTAHLGELQRMNTRLTDSYESTLQALSRALDTRDEETEEHSQRVKHYTSLIAEQLGVPEEEREDMLRGALLHDIGKIGVPDAILLKPGRLTPEELTIMRKHPEIGYGMIAHIPFLTRAAQVVLHHHESYDGNGYPSGLAGDTIPLGARIFAVADTFDAMTSDRPYRAALPVERAMEELHVFTGRQFDPDVVEAFQRIPMSQLLAVRNGHALSRPAAKQDAILQHTLVTT